MLSTIDEDIINSLSNDEIITKYVDSIVIHYESSSSSSSSDDDLDWYIYLIIALSIFVCLGSCSVFICYYKDEITTLLPSGDSSTDTHQPPNSKKLELVLGKQNNDRVVIDMGVLNNKPKTKKSISSTSKSFAQICIQKFCTFIPQSEGACAHDMRSFSF